MIRNLLICGLLAGIVGAGVAAGFAEIAGEPAINAAIALEKPKASAEAQHDAPIVSRDIQRAVGLPVATILYGSAVGGLFALAFAFVYGRVGRGSPAATAMWLAGGAFVVLFLVPFLKYSSNPPAVGDPNTIGQRSALYALMVAISLLAAIAAARIHRTVGRRSAGLRGPLVGVASYVVIVAIAAFSLPTIQEVPPGFPATTLWRFRESTVGTQLVLWAVIGVAFGFLAQRVLTRSAPQAPGAPTGPATAGE